MKNVQLSDEIMAQASGGVTVKDDRLTEFDASGTVIEYIGDCQYHVRLEDGGEVMASFDERHIVEPGTNVGLLALYGGWVMKEL